MKTKKALLTIAAALSVSGLAPLSALAVPGFFQAAACGAGASTSFGNAGTSQFGILGSISSLDTTISGNGTPQRAGYELRLSGLRTPRVPNDRTGFQNALVQYLIPENGNIDLSHVFVRCHFEGPRTIDKEVVTKSFAELGGGSRSGVWQFVAFDAGKIQIPDPTWIMSELVVYQENTDNSVTKIRFGKMSVTHAQGFLDNGFIDFKDGGCPDLDTAGTAGSVTGNSLREQFQRRRAARAR